MKQIQFTKPITKSIYHAFFSWRSALILYIHLCFHKYFMNEINQYYNFCSKKFLFIKTSYKRKRLVKNVYNNVMLS